MKIKSVIILSVIFAIFQQLNAQNLCIAPAHLQCDTKLPEMVDTQIHSKILRALSNNGISAESGFARYIIAPQIAVNSSHTTGGIPSRVEVNFDLAFHLVDLKNGKVFSSYSFPIASKGANMANAIAKGVANLSLEKPEFAKFLNGSKEKVLNYYEQELPKLLSRAKASVQSQNYEEALAILAEVPEDISGYERVLPILTSTYKAYADHEAAALLQQAKAAWASSPNQSGAQAAAELIAQMPVGSSSAGAASQLLKSINAKMRVDDTRAWRMAQQAMRNAHLERTALIKAAREVAVERARNSRPIVVGYRIW